MDTVMIFVVLNLCYLGVWLLIHTFRTTKNVDWRIMDNDYEFFETLPEDRKERYWSRISKETDRFMFHFALTMNLSLMPMLLWQVENIILTFGIFMIGFIISFMIYIGNYKKIKKQAKE